MRRKSARFSTRGAALVVVFAAIGAAICRTPTDVRPRDEVVVRAAVRWSLDAPSNVRVERPNVEKNVENAAPSSFARRFRAEFDARLADRAARFLAASDADARERRTVATANGLARWGVDERTARRVFASLAPTERAAANDAFARGEPLDFAFERAAAATSARFAVDALQATPRESDASRGVDAAIEFLREFESESPNVAAETPGAEPIFWALDVESGDPFDSFAVATRADFVASRSIAARVAERSFEAFGLIFFGLTVPFGGGLAPGSVVESFGGAAAIRRKFADFFATLAAARLRWGAFLAAFGRLVSFALLAQIPFERRFGADSARILSPFAAALTTVRLLN